MFGALTSECPEGLINGCGNLRELFLLREPNNEFASFSLLRSKFNFPFQAVNEDFYNSKSKAVGGFPRCRTSTQLLKFLKQESLIVIGESRPTVFHADPKIIF